MPTVNSSLPEELYLSTSMTALTDSLNLAPAATAFLAANLIYLRDSSLKLQGSAVVRGMTFTRRPSGKASSTGHSGMVMDIEIPLAITGASTPFTNGDPIIANIQALATKNREAARGSGAGSLAASVWLWMKFVYSSHYVYWALDGAPDVQWLKPQYPATNPVLAALLTFHCLPYAFGDPVYDAASATLTPTSPSIYRSAIPGDHEAAPRLWILDQSGNSKQAQQWTIYGRSIDGMAAGDWPPSYGLTAVSPATQVSDTAAYNGTRAHLASVTSSWQNVGYAQSGSGAFETQEALLKWRVRDTATPLGTPLGTAPSLNLTGGALGAGPWLYTPVAYDGSGHLGPNGPTMSAIVPGIQETTPVILAADGLNDLSAWFALNTGSGAGTASVSSNVLTVASTGASYCFLQRPLQSGVLSVKFGFQAGTLPAGTNAAILPVALIETVSGTTYLEYGIGYQPSSGNWFVGHMTGSSSAPGSTMTADGAAITALGTSAHTIEFVYTVGAAAGIVAVFIDGVWQRTISDANKTAPSSFYAEAGWGGTTGASNKYSDLTIATGAQTEIVGGTASATVSWTAPASGPVPSGYRLYITDPLGNVRFIDNGASTSYTHTSPTAGTSVASLPTATSPVQNTLLRVGVGLTLAEAEQNAKSAAAFPTVVANNEWEYLTGRTEPLPNSVIPEGQIAPPWFAVLQAMNPGTATAPSLDADQMAPLPKDGTAVTVSCPLTLARPAWVQLDDRRDHRISALWGDTTTITASGSEITDATRTTGTSGDGLAVPAGYGIWQATTNLCTNGGFESNTTGWFTNASATLTRQTGVSAFGSASLHLSFSGTVGDDAEFSASGNATQGVSYTGSIRVKAHSTSDIGKIVRLVLQSGGGTFEQFGVDITLSAAWQWATLPITWANAGHTTWGIRAMDNRGQGAFSCDLDGVQYEQSAVATPYVETNGSTATRSAARVQRASSNITATAGTWARGVGWDVASSAFASATATIASWYDSASNLIELTYHNGNWTLTRVGSGTSGSVSVADSWSAGVTRNVVAAWNSTTLSLSIGGATYSTAAQSAIPTLPETTYDVGSRTGTANWLNSRILWAMDFTVAVSQATATTLGDLGARTPTPDDVSETAWTAIWNARGSRVALNTPLAFGTFAGSLRAGPTTALAALPEFWDASGNVISDVQDAAWTMQARWLPQLEFLRGAN